MPDRLFIRGIEVSCRLGVYEWEQEKPQTVWVDLELPIDAAKAAKHDDVKDGVDYAKVVEVVKARAQRRAFRLMETLAEELASAVLKESHAPRVTVRVKKRALHGIDHAAVEITRKQDRAAWRGRTTGGSGMRRLARAVAVVFVLAGAAGVVRAQDPLEVGPDVYSKLFENERVRVCEAKFKPGQSIAMHSHPDHFVYIMNGGTLKLSYPDGTSKDITAKPGEVMWLNAESHAAVNTGTTDVRILVVELKP